MIDTPRSSQAQGPGKSRRVPLARRTPENNKPIVNQFTAHGSTWRSLAACRSGRSRGKEMVTTRSTCHEGESLPVRPGIGVVSVADVGRAGERRRLPLHNGAVLDPGRGASCRATGKVSRLRGHRRMGAGRPLFGLVEPAILFQRILRLLIGFAENRRFSFLARKNLAAAPGQNHLRRIRDMRRATDGDAEPIAQDGVGQSSLRRVTSDNRAIGQCRSEGASGTSPRSPFWAVTHCRNQHRRSITAPYFPARSRGPNGLTLLPAAAAKEPIRVPQNLRANEGIGICAHHNGPRLVTRGPTDNISSRRVARHGCYTRRRIRVSVLDIRALSLRLPSVGRRGD